MSRFFAHPRLIGRCLPAVLAAISCLTALAANTAASPCRLPGFKQEVLCGSVKRPLDPAQPRGVSIDVHYVVVPALARRKLADPVVLFAGGPGQSAINIAPQVMGLMARLNNRRDIVFIDQRGVGRSAPLLCDSDEEKLDTTDDAEMYRQMDVCRAKLQALPYGDLRFFTTTIAMQDIDAVRAALGAAQINVVGASYGTRAALEYLRLYPDHVRRMVLDGVAPADMPLPLSISSDGERALQAVLAACRADKACHARYPALDAKLQALLASLPRKVTVNDVLTGEPVTVTISRDLLMRVLQLTLYMPSITAGLPAALAAASNDQFEPLVGLISTAGIGGKSKARKAMALAAGMHLSVVCAEDVPRLDDPQAVADNPLGAMFGDTHKRYYQRACSQWPRGNVDPAFYRIPPSKVPVLLLSGGDDPVTPPRHAARVAKALGPQVKHLVVSHAGHGVLSVGCAPDLFTRFIAEPERELDSQCLAKIPRPPVFLPILSPARSQP